MKKIIGNFWNFSFYFLNEKNEKKTWNFLEFFLLLCNFKKMKEKFGIYLFIL
jgi:hypothetical protein